MAATVVLTGLKELDRKLKALETKIANKIVKQGVRAGAKVLLQAAKAKAPVAEGDLKKAIKIKTAKRSRKKRTYSLLVQVGNTDFVGDQFYAAMIEFGTSKMLPQPFLRPAADEKRAEAQAAAVAKIKAGLAAEVKRVA